MNQNPLSVSPEQNSAEQTVISGILAEIRNQYRLDLAGDPTALDRISQAVHKARLELEVQPEAEVNLPFISANAAGPIHYLRKLSRADFMMAGEGDDPPAGFTVPAPMDQESLPQQRSVELPNRKPIVTNILLVVTILIYLLQLLTDYTIGYDLPAALGMKSNELIISGQYWRLFTPMFLHGSIIHLGFNMYALNILGRRVERFFGPYRFLGLYLLAGITGNIFSFLFTVSPSLGSSTAVFGLLGAEGIFIYQHQKLFGDQSRTALRQIIQVAAINLLIGLSPGIDNWGHVGGLIGGAVFTWFTGPKYQVSGQPPLLTLEDKRTPAAIGIGFVLQLLILIGVTALIVSA